MRRAPGGIGTCNMTEAATTRDVTISPQAHDARMPQTHPQPCVPLPHLSLLSVLQISTFSAMRTPVTLIPVPARSSSRWWRISARSLFPPMRHSCVHGHPTTFSQMTNELPQAALNLIASHLLLSTFVRTSPPPLYPTPAARIGRGLWPDFAGGFFFCLFVLAYPSVSKSSPF